MTQSSQQVSGSKFLAVIFGICFLGAWLAAVAWVLQGAINTLLAAWLRLVPAVDYFPVFLGLLAWALLLFTAHLLRSLVANRSTSTEDFGQFMQGMIMGKLLQAATNGNK